MQFLSSSSFRIALFPERHFRVATQYSRASPDVDTSSARSTASDESGREDGNRHKDLRCRDHVTRC